MGNTDNLIDNMRVFYPKFDEISPRVLNAIRKVDRKLFLDDTIVALLAVDPEKYFEALRVYHQSTNDVQFSDDLKAALDSLFRSYTAYTAEVSGLAYTNKVLPIGDGQTCSQPSVVAFMADKLELREGLSVLEGGTGCGYNAAIVSELIAPSGRLVTVEINPRLVQVARRNIRAQFGDGIEERIKIIEGDVIEASEKSRETFDRIYFTAAGDLERLDIGRLIGKLKDGTGIILLPDKRETLLWQKYENGVKVRENVYEGYTFVPLQGKSS